MYGPCQPLVADEKHPLSDAGDDGFAHTPIEVFELCCVTAHSESCPADCAALSRGADMVGAGNREVSEAADTENHAALLENQAELLEKAAEIPFYVAKEA